MNSRIITDLHKKYDLTGDNYRIDGIYDEWKKGNIDIEIVWEYYQNRFEILNAKNDPFPSLEKRQNRQRVQEILNELEVGIRPKMEKENRQTSSQNDPVIFLSHRSSDKKYGDALRDLICGLGVKNEGLIYTAHPLHKIPLDKNIYDYLRENLAKSVYVIFLLSNEYFTSSACLNEMGAAWLAQKDYTNIFIPNFDFRNENFQDCVIDTDKMGIVLKRDRECQSRMIDFKNKITGLFGLQINEQSWMYLLDSFMAAINPNDVLSELPINNDMRAEYGNKNVSPAVPAQSSSTTLSDEAKELLKEISLDTNGILGVIETLRGYVVQTNKKNFGCDHSDARTRATIENAIEELEHNSCIKPINKEREMFRITQQGYKMADTI
jgi:hypothetical protein